VASPPRVSWPGFSGGFNFGIFRRELGSMKIIDLRRKEENGKPLKAFVDVELDGGIVVREFRIIQEPNKRPWIACPQMTWKDPETGLIRYKTIVTFPNQLKGDIDLLILSTWNREKEKASEHFSR
jgi:DNA-binding cell septation regulator SpoVG